MFVTLLVIVPAGVALAILSLPASRRSRVNAAAAGGSAAPPRPGAPRGAARPEIQPRDERQPFGSDGIVAAGEGHREAARPREAAKP